MNPRNPYAVYVGLESGGVHVSTDGGEHWRVQRIKDEGPALFGPQLTDLAFGPGRRPTLWAGSRLQGAYRGNEIATEWIALGLRARWIDAIAADQRRPRVAYVLSDGHVLRTVDNGAHWKPLSLAGIVGLTIQPKTNALYAWSGSAIFRSRDAGESWTRLAPLPR